LKLAISVATSSYVTLVSTTPSSKPAELISK